jgi:hypothetical protein
MRKVTPEELLALINQGAKISREDDEPRVIAGFAELVKQMEALVEAQKQTARAQSELLTAVMGRLAEAMEKFKGGTVDLKPLEALVKQIDASHHVERPRYEFQVKRNQRGLLTGMTASPEKHTIN